MDALEYKPNQHSSESSATRENDAILQLTGQDLVSPVSSSKKMKMSAEASGSREINTVSTNKHEYRLRSRSKSIPTSPVPLVQECVTEDDEDNMQDESDDESLEGFGSVGEPVEAARTASSSEPVEAATTTSYAEGPTVVSKLVPLSSPKDISAPLLSAQVFLVEEAMKDLCLLTTSKSHKSMQFCIKRSLISMGIWRQRKSSRRMILS